MLPLDKSSLTILLKSSKRIFGKIFDGEMLSRMLPTTLHQIFREIIFNSKTFVKRIIGTGNLLLIESINIITHLHMGTELNSAVGANSRLAIQQD